MLVVKPNVTIRTGNEERKYKNMMLQQGLDWVLDLTAGLASGVLTHVVVGDGASPVSLGDLQLGNELARKTITAVTRDTGVTIAEVFFDKTEANFTWKEIGLVVAGTATAGSGKLVARAIVTEEKDVNRTATITWEIGLQNA